MKLPVTEFLVKVAILLALVGLSTYREVATVYPHVTLGYYVGNVIPWLLGVAVVGSVGLMVWGVVVLLSDAKNKDIGRALVLGGIYLLTIWAIWVQGNAIQQFRETALLGGDLFKSMFGGGDFAGLYVLGLIAAMPGVQKIYKIHEAHMQQIAQRRGINRWLLVGASFLLVFVVVLLMSGMLTDLGFNILMSGEIGGGFAIVYGLVMFLSDAVLGRLRFWKISFPRLVRGKKWGAMSLALINSKNWHGLLLLTEDWLTAERGNRESWISKGLAHEMLGDAHRAISAYQVALKIRYDETIAKRIDALVEGRVRQNQAREEQERKTKAEDKRAREQRTRHSSSKSSDTGSGRSSNGTQFECYYRILEIQPGVTINEVKAAYKRQVQQYHPDKVASLGKELRDLAEAKSKEINEAYRAIMAALST